MNTASHILTALAGYHQPFNHYLHDWFLVIGIPGCFFLLGMGFGINIYRKT